MKQILKAATAVGIALLIVLTVRAYAFTVYTLPTDIGQMFRQGDRVLVNRLSRPACRKGDLILFEQDGRRIGRVDALPGDTIRISGKFYRLPTRCCDRCTCPECRLYLVNTGQRQTLVYKHQMTGKAKRLFHLPF